MPVRNPRTGAFDHVIRPLCPEDLDAEAIRLRGAQPAWAALGVEGRAAVLGAWQEELAKARDALVRAVLTDTGRMRESVLEVDATIRMVERWRAQAPGLLTQPAERPSAVIPAVAVATEGVPYPLVGVISPWNFPLLLSLIDSVPALLAGCAVLVKPSEVTPRFIGPLMETVRAVPELASVLSVVEGAGATGAALVERVDAVCFTGSVATGRKVAEGAARAFIPAFLELGGKDPGIVTATADLPRAAAALLSGSVTNAGQACQSIERIYVDRRVAEPFLAELTRRAEAMRLSWPDPAEGEIGPIIFDRQAEIIADHIADAVAKGARILTGGEIERHGGGCWVRPTVLSGVDHSMRIMTEESFGPLLPVMEFDTEEEAVGLANDTAYGLSACVFAADEADARRIAARLEVGAVSINDASLTSFIHDAEKNSFRLSGMGGSRMGAAGLTRFLRKRALLINRLPGPAPWWLAGPAT